MAFEIFSRKIENRTFSCSFDQKKIGRWCKITERQLRRSFDLVLEEVLVVWIIDCRDGFMWIQKITNKRGTFLEIINKVGVCPMVNRRS